MFESGFFIIAPERTFSREWATGREIQPDQNRPMGTAHGTKDAGENRKYARDTASFKTYYTSNKLKKRQMNTPENTPIF